MTFRFIDLKVLESLGLGLPVFANYLYNSRIFERFLVNIDLRASYPGVIGLRGDGYVRAKIRKLTLRETEILTYMQPLEIFFPKFHDPLRNSIFDFCDFREQFKNNSQPEITEF